MKTVILDENLPIDLRLLLQEFDVVTVRYKGWTGVKNGSLVKLIDGQFDVLITGDKNLRYQQNLSNRIVSIVELPFTLIDLLEERIEEVRSAIRNSTVGSYIQIRP